jgi:hypothetical protein
VPRNIDPPQPQAKAGMQRTAKVFIGRDPSSLAMAATQQFDHRQSVWVTAEE